MNKIDINDVVEFVCELNNDYKKLRHCKTYEDCDECPSEDVCHTLMHITFALCTVADARLNGMLKDDAKEG